MVRLMGMLSIFLSPQDEVNLSIGYLVSFGPSLRLSLDNSRSHLVLQIIFFSLSSFVCSSIFPFVFVQFCSGKIWLLLQLPPSCSLSSLPPHSYIRMVCNTLVLTLALQLFFPRISAFVVYNQKICGSEMLERCLLLHMNQQQSVKALAQYASIQPCVTITVWRELEKENKDFFEAYVHAVSPYSYRSFVGKC
ncbi:uncharacterized protein LOC120211348 [Hibiscus syriacus]|uniref:uncharacterized protein LOC120211348 n=1 Tax=Hibiscus syriacus TaxID=106335 RepID=UPI001924605F|nr:uncharacterized protein LOC120211348 [Hibiscus syriacus]